MAEGTAEKSHIHWTFCVSDENNDKGQAREGEWAEIREASNICFDVRQSCKSATEQVEPEPK